MLGFLVMRKVASTLPYPSGVGLNLTLLHVGGDVSIGGKDFWHLWMGWSLVGQAGGWCSGKRSHVPHDLDAGPVSPPLCA